MTKGTSTSTLCQWCEKPFRARRGGGSKQRFCGAKCRTLFWSALRRVGERAVAASILTIDDLKSGSAAACTLPQASEPSLPLSDIGRGYTSPSGALLRFLVEIERDTVAWLVRLRFISPDESDDLAALLAALKRLGQAPSISRVA